MLPSFWTSENLYDLLMFLFFYFGALGSHELTLRRLSSQQRIQQRIQAVAAVSYVRPYGRRNKRMHEAMGQGTARVVGDPSFTWQRACDDEAYAVAAFDALNGKVRAIHSFAEDRSPFYHATHFAPDDSPPPFW